jgi:adenylate cyclase
MGKRLSADELSERSGATRELVAESRRLGLIEDKASDSQAVERLRLIQLLVHRGIAAEMVAEVERAHPGILQHFVDLLYPDGDWPRSRLADVADEHGVELGTARRIWEVAGQSEQGDWLTELDGQAIRQLVNAIEVGFPQDALLQMVRVYADALGRVAEAEARFFHFFVHEQRRASGASFEEVSEATSAARDQLLARTEAAISYFHRRGMVKAIREDVVLHMTEEAGLTQPGTVTGELPLAILFVDLASFTSLTEAMGDVSAAQVLERFSELVRRAANRCGGRVAKQIGDAFMLVFVDAPSAVRCAVDVARAVAEEPQFPGVRMGLHAGPVLYREGDYVGATVNVAARVAAEADRGQVLVSRTVRETTGAIDGVAFVPVGRRALRGLSEPVTLFDAVLERLDKERPVDPVCGMALFPSDVGARLSLGEVDYVFCSEGCLQRFVADPGRYGVKSLGSSSGSNC